MFERYTEKARRVIFFARYEGSQAGAEEIEPQHLLLGLVREDPPLLTHFVTNGKTSVERMRAEIARHLGPRERIPSPLTVEMPLASATKHVLHFAHEESDRL